MVKIDSFIKNSFLLITSNLTTGILGFIFSIILSNALKAEGMGLYGLVMPVYNLFICLICGGITTAVSKVSAEYYAKKQYENLRKSINTTLVFNLIWGLIIISLVYLFSQSICTYIIKDRRTVFALKLTCPAMLFISLTSTLKGYFYGILKVGVPAFIDIFEKSVRILILLSVLKITEATSLTATVTIAYLALCIGEFISLIFLFSYYKLDIKKYNNSSLKSEGRGQLIFDVLYISMPLCINGFLTTILSTTSALIVPRRLMQAGIAYQDSLSLIGRFNSMATGIAFFPLIIVSSISTLLIPDISQSLSKKDFIAVEKRIQWVLRISFVLGMSTLIICMVLGDNLGRMFFKRDDLGDFIRFSALSAPILFTMVSSIGILNGLGKQNIILRNSIITSITELILLSILTGIPSINIYGYGINIFITSTLLLVMNLSVISDYIKLKFNLVNVLIFILVALLFYDLMKFSFNYILSNKFIVKNILLISLGFLMTPCCIIMMRLIEKRE